MKIRIKDNHIRFRIQENELETLLNGDSLETALSFPNQTMTWVLRIGYPEEHHAHYIDQKYIIELGQSTREIWRENPRQCIAFSSNHPTTNALIIEVELDLMRDK